jgi:hypothetical protein
MTLSELVGEIDSNRQQGNCRRPFGCSLDYFRPAPRHRCRIGSEAAGLGARRTAGWWN